MNYKILIVILALGTMIRADAYAAETKKSLKILGVGDSTTAGTPGFQSPAEAPPEGAGDEKSQYAYWMMRRHPEWQVSNRGVAGKRSDEILARLGGDLEIAKPQVVIILAGVNDVYQGRSVGSVEANLQKMYKLATNGSRKIVACTILPYNTADPIRQKRILEINDWIQSYAKDHGFIFCDTFRALNSADQPFHLINSPDGMHPSLEDYKRMGETITEAVEKGTAI